MILLLGILVLISGISFMAYGIAYFTTPHMKSEFIRFGLEKYGRLTAILEIAGAIGLVAGLWSGYLLLLSSGGLALLMFLGVMVRIKVGDSLWALLPALAFMLLNSFIFLKAIENLR